MSNIHLLDTQATEIQASVIEILEGMLEHAKAGEIHGIAIAIIRSDGAANGTYSASNQAAALLGSMQLLSHRLMEEIK